MLAASHPTRYAVKQRRRRRKATMAPLVEDEQTLIMANAARLLADAKLLANHTRFASAFALAVLGVEEIGKVILDIWETAEPLPTPKIRKSSHLRKQSAVGSVLLASFALSTVESSRHP
jgi:hypothetical protein